MKRINEIGKSFKRAAVHYEQTARIQTEIGERMLERLQYIKIKPEWILDLGCGSGYFSQKLRQYYPNAHVVSLDLVPAMLQEVKKKQRWWRRWPLLCADMHYLPFSSNQFDLIFSNQVLHWSHDIPSLFRELTRILRVEGCFMYSTLGPDTFKEIRQVYASIDAYSHVNDFMDMHDLGDHMLRANLHDPVVDMEYIQLHYSCMEKLLLSLKMQGVKNIHANRNKGLSGRKRYDAFQKRYREQYSQNGKYPLTYEVIYGLGWKEAPKQSINPQEVRIPVLAIKRPER